MVTDHNSLVYLEKMKDENGRLARWAMALMPYMYTTVHRPGSKNQNADGMLRQSWPTVEINREEPRHSKEKKGRMSEEQVFVAKLLNNELLYKLV